MHLRCEKYKTISDESITENIFDEKYKKGYDLRYNIFCKDNEDELVRIKEILKIKIYYLIYK